MTHIDVGGTLPEVELREETPDNVINIGLLVRGKKALVFGVPGAFVVECSKIHLRGFILKSDELKSKGFDEIICVSVNDPYVLSTWGWKLGARGKVRLLADPDASFAKAIGMDVERPDLGGVRSRRYSMITENGIVKELFVEEGKGKNACLERPSVRIAL